MENKGIKKGKSKTIFSFYRPKEDVSTSSKQPPSNVDQSHCKRLRVDVDVDVDVNSLERDPAIRTPIWQLPINQRNEIRRAYIKIGPYQPLLSEYPPTENNAARYAKFTLDGFKSWKRVNNGERCSFLLHVGDSTSHHSNNVKSIDDLRNVSRHINKVIKEQVSSSEDVPKNRLRLKATIESVRWLSLQACAFRGHDESTSSHNQGNFIEMLRLLGRMNDGIGDIILENAPQNAKYTSPKIQKDILHILANKVRNKIREDIGDAKFCILVDEAKDVSSREQMALVLRFVDVSGFVQERFFDIVHVTDTTAATLKKEISNVLGRHNLHICNMRDQGYDGASNMRGSWNGLQALFLRDCPYAYYVHCFAHRLQLALVAAAEKEVSVWLFFSKMNSIVNIFSSSPKRLAELHDAQVVEIAHMIATGERCSGRGANQIGSLQRAGKTRWSSHFESICSVVDLFSPLMTVLENIVDGGSSNTIKGEATGALIALRTFDFIFILRLMQKIMGVTDLLCQALQKKSLNILSAMDFVSNVKGLLQDLREKGYDILYDEVVVVCSKFSSGGVNNRFNDESVELLRLSASLDPRDGFKLFDIDRIYTLADKFYPDDFSGQEMHYLRSQLEHYRFDVLRDEKFRDISTISELCQRLVETNKSTHYHLIDRLIRLVLTLPVTTATTERAFSAMKIVKTVLRNKMEEEFLADNMVVYIERELSENVDVDSVIDEFYSMKNRRAPLQ